MYVLLIHLFIKNPPEKEANLATKKEGENGVEKSPKRGNRSQNRIKMRKNSYREAYMINFSHPMKKNYHTSEDFFTSSPGLVTYL